MTLRYDSNEAKMKLYEIRDYNNERVLIINDQEYRTNYSRKLIEAIIERKGIDRTPKYLTHKSERSIYLQLLFDYLNKKASGLRVLEVGCSSGHITEYLNDQPSISEIYAYDVDRAFVEITRLKKDELVLSKVKSIDHLTNRATQNLPYNDNFFDLIIVMAVVEHLPYENRHVYVDEYYRVLKIEGLIGFWDTPNRYFPFERHSIGLPLVSLLPPQIAYIYSKIFKKNIRKISFPQFARAGTGWRNSSYYELLPKSLMIDIEDVSEEIGYKVNNKLIRAIANLFGVPTSFFAPSLNIVFKKTKNYEYSYQ